MRNMKSLISLKEHNDTDLINLKMSYMLIQLVSFKLYSTVLNFIIFHYLNC
jgi:hypothetical protein